MTHGNHDRHSVTEISIDALHSHCNQIYKASSFVGEEFLMNIVLMVSDVPWPGSEISEVRVIVAVCWTVYKTGNTETCCCQQMM